MAQSSGGNYLEYLHVTTVTSSGDHPAASPPQVHINLHFLCKPVFYLYSQRPDSDEPRLQTSRSNDHIKHNHVRLSLEQLMDGEKAEDLAGQKLRRNMGLVSADMRREWVEWVLGITRGVVGSMPPEHRVVDIQSSVIHHYRFIVDVRSPPPPVVVVEEESDINSMIPAEESWIDRTLVKKTLTEYSSSGGNGTCAVCMEDLSGGVSRMPCEHYFHGDCIGKWLRTSHYCPVCRFEVPTSS